MPRVACLGLIVLTMTLSAADFPAWRGADGSGSAGTTAVPLIASWDQSRIAWVSEAMSPHPWNFSVVRGKTQWPRTVLGNGGYCLPALYHSGATSSLPAKMLCQRGTGGPGGASPLMKESNSPAKPTIEPLGSGLAGLWQGKVYLMYWRPAGTVTATDGSGKYDRMWANSGCPALSLIDADACVVCMDAATGRTLWETVFSGTEMNHVELYGGHNNVCVADGRVFAIGGTGLIYAVDAVTGAKLWSAALGPSAAVWRWYKAQCLAKRSKEAGPPSKIPDGETVPPAPTQTPHPLGGSLNDATYNVCPTVVDGVVVSGEWARSSSIVAFDATSGNELWRKPGGGIPTPLP